MNETAFFQAADDFKVPAGNRFHPLCKEAGAVAVTQCAGPDDTRALHCVALHGTMKTAQHLERLGHRLRIKIAIAKYTFTQAGNFAVLVQGDQAPAPKFSNTESHRVGTDIDRGKDGHVLSGGADISPDRLDGTRRFFGWRMRQPKNRRVPSNLSGLMTAPPDKTCPSLPRSISVPTRCDSVLLNFGAGAWSPCTRTAKLPAWVKVYFAMAILIRRRWPRRSRCCAVFIVPCRATQWSARVSSG